MRIPRISLLPCLMLAGLCSAHAADSSTPSWGGSFHQKFAAGNGGYRASDTTVDATLPYGFDVNAELGAYKTETSSTTPTITFGAGWSKDAVDLYATYAVTTLANDYESTAVDIGAGVHDDSDDFRTDLSADVEVTHHRSFLRLPKVTSEQDLTQKTPTLSLEQQLFNNWTSRVVLSQSNYNRDLLIYSRILGLTRTRAQRALSRSDGSLMGLIAGFPDWSAKFGLDYEFDALPLTLHASYETIHLVTTAQVSNATADATAYSADYGVRKWATISAEYDHTRQTSQAASDDYALKLALRF